MSIKVMSWVWENAPRHLPDGALLQPTQMLLLVAIADVVNDDGETWERGLSKPTLARKVRASLDTIDRQMAALTRLGLLASRSIGPGKPLVWRITMDRDDLWTGAAEGQTPPQSAPPSPPRKLHPPANCTPPQSAPPTPPQSAPPVPSCSFTVPSTGAVAPRTVNEDEADVLPLHVPASSHAPKKPRQATRIPDGWQPTPELLAWAHATVPGVNAAWETEQFRDYWSAASGQRATKADWAATWRQWMRNAAKYAQTPPRPAPANAAPATQAWRRNLA